MSIKEPQADTGVSPLKLRLGSLELTDEMLLETSSLNRDLRLERTAEGDLIIMPPTGGITGERNSEINMQLRLWAKKDGTGKTFDSSTGFRLPNSAVCSPDVAWVSKARLEKIPREKQMKYIPLCPEFVIELRSLTDKLETLREKMRLYIENGALLGWLLEPDLERVHIYTQEGLETTDNLDTLSGEPLLPGFALNLNEIWSL